MALIVIPGGEFKLGMEIVKVGWGNTSLRRNLAEQDADSNTTEEASLSASSEAEEFLEDEEPEAMDDSREYEEGFVVEAEVVQQKKKDVDR